MYEQAEDLVDIVSFPLKRSFHDSGSVQIYSKIIKIIEFSLQLKAAGDFAEEINTLCDDESQHLSKEMIKRLFAIEIESDLSHSIKVNTMVRRSVRPELAIMFDCPQVIAHIIYCYEEYCVIKLFSFSSSAIN